MIPLLLYNQHSIADAPAVAADRSTTAVVVVLASIVFQNLEHKNYDKSIDRSFHY